MKKIILSIAFLGAGVFQTSAQTITATAAGPVNSSTTFGSGTGVVVGASAGAMMNNTTGQSVFVGHMSGNQTIGSDNTFVGWASGPNTTTGTYNTFLGRSSGASNTIGTYNTIIGALAGLNNTTGGANTILGFGAGGENLTGAGNVFLGFNAGRLELGSNKLYIDNSDTSLPLIWGDFALDQLKLNGKVGIGFGTTTNFPTNAGGVNVSGYNLFVAGGILTEEVRVNSRTSNQWADYVFNKDYELKSLEEVEKFINENGHLPNVPSAAQVKEEGIALGEMTKIQQEKIEELTLYLIQQSKQIEELKAQVKELQKKQE